MKLLQRILRLQAGIWGVAGLLAIVTPRWLLATAIDQPVPGDTVWLQALGITSIVLALLMVLVSQKLEEVWWWSWAFAVLSIGAATIAVLHALVGLPDGAAAWPWWLLGGGDAALGAGALLGLAQAGQEKPFV